MEKIYDLAFEIEGENIRLEQDAGIGEIHVIDLHMIHLRLLAERAGLLPRLLPPVLPCLAECNDEMHHLQIEQDDDGTIHLYQTQISGMCGSDEHLMLHAAQAAWLGARLLSLGQFGTEKAEDTPLSPVTPRSHEKRPAATDSEVQLEMQLGQQ